MVSTSHGAHDRDRTGDLVLTKDVLCQLSYMGLTSRRRPSPPIGRKTPQPMLVCTDSRVLRPFRGELGTYQIKGGCQKILTTDFRDDPAGQKPMLCSNSISQPSSEKSCHLALSIREIPVIRGQIRSRRPRQAFGAETACPAFSAGSKTSATRWIDSARPVVSSISIIAPHSITGPRATGKFTGML